MEYLRRPLCNRHPSPPGYYKPQYKPLQYSKKKSEQNFAKPEYRTLENFNDCASLATGIRTNFRREG